MSLDPLFVDASHDNFRIEMNSPAINSGKDVGIESDFYGFRVPSGGKPDIGICEITDNSNDPGNGEVNVSQNEVIAYPNPTNGIINIQLVKTNDSPNNYSKLEIADISGKVVYYTQINDVDEDVYSIDISNLPRGFYVLILNTGNSQSIQKIILQ